MGGGESVDAPYGGLEGYVSAEFEAHACAVS